MCDDQQTPSGATDCGNQMVSDGVAAVLNSVSGQDGSMFTPVAAANIPFVGYYHSGQNILLAKTGAYILTNGISSSFAAPAKIAQAGGAKRAAELVIDVPGASGPAKLLDPVFYKNAGDRRRRRRHPAGHGGHDAPDHRRADQEPRPVAVVGDVTFCTSAIKAIKTSGTTKPS